MVRQDIAVARAVKGRVVRRLTAFNGEDLGPGQLIRWFEVAVRIEREARGLAGNRIEVQRAGEESRDSAIVRAIVDDPIAAEHALAALERVAIVGRQSGASGDLGDGGDA